MNSFAELQAPSSKLQAPSSKLQAPSVDSALANDPSRGQPIVIRFGYQWRKPDELGKADIWPSVREALKGVAAECVKLRNNRDGGGRLNVSYGRLRARHGTTVINSIVGRIRRADILIFDLADFNPNVLF